ncbi:MAG: (2Fe-2S)-binding protein [Clostridia bacterium]|nr:(2Fe-2S)-binding protein [Clostridia bacterium]
MEQKFYKCSHCGKIVALVKESGVPVMCCGTKMEEIIPGSVDASEEKHVPCFTIEDNMVVVTIGEVEHPMTEEHHIEWVSLQTNRGNQRKFLSVGDKPAICFSLCPNEKVEAVYAYCNLHGLWKAESETEKLVCDLKPLDTETNENYVICKCNNVSYFDIMDAVNNHGSIDGLLNVFEDVKNTTKCSTGCGGCYDKVLAIISASMHK